MSRAKLFSKFLEWKRKNGTSFEETLILENIYNYIVATIAYHFCMN